VKEDRLIFIKNKKEELIEKNNEINNEFNLN
jgi:hypothetical protein